MKNMKYGYIIVTMSLRRINMKSRIGYHCLNYLNLNPKNNLNPNQIMSTYQKKDGDISVFHNHSDNANAPAFKGNLLLNGIEYQVSLWRKQGAKGEFLAGNVQQKQQSAERPAQTQSHSREESNDLPF